MLGEHYTSPTIIKVIQTTRADYDNIFLQWRFV